jgi:hypothetical protein
MSAAPGRNYLTIAFRHYSSPQGGLRGHNTLCAWVVEKMLNENVAHYVDILLVQSDNCFEVVGIQFFILQLQAGQQ